MPVGPLSANTLQAVSSFSGVELTGRSRALRLAAFILRAAGGKREHHSRAISKLIIFFFSVTFILLFSLIIIPRLFNRLKAAVKACSAESEHACKLGPYFWEWQRIRFRRRKESDI